MLTPNLKRYANEKVESLLTLLKESKDERQSGPELGSMAESGAIDLGVLPPDTEMIVSNGIRIKSCVSGDCWGFDELDFPEYSKFIDELYKDSSISNQISRQFLDKRVFDWLVKTRRKQISDNFADVLVPQLSESVKTYRFYFKVLYLQINKSFTIGDVKFDFVRKEFFDNMGDSDSPDVEEFRSKMYESHKGDVFVTTEQIGEKGKARDEALSRCSLAMDVLKICSHTLEQPDLKLSFDIDIRTRESPQSEYFSDLEVVKDVGLIRTPMNFQMTSVNWEFFVKRSIGSFARSVFASAERTELQDLVRQSITLFANALSNANYHQRIAELFTIMESILVSGSGANIQDTMSKYCAKLTRQSLETRRELIKFLKDMYAVRSSYMHYAKLKAFEIKDLRLLQLVVHRLLLAIIGKFQDHKTKASLLKEIDDGMIAA